MTGADSPVIADLVHRGDAFDHLAVAGDHVARPARGRGRPCAAGRPAPPRRRRGRCGSREPLAPGVCVRELAQRVGLRLAAAFGHRLGEVGEQHREPEPERELEREADVGRARARRRGPARASCSTLPTSTTNITGFRTMCRGSSFDERVAAMRAGATIGRIERAAVLSEQPCLEEPPGAHQEVLDDRARARAPGRRSARRRSGSRRPAGRRTAASVTGKVPADSGAIFFSARKPASASIGTIIAKRPKSIARPSSVL